MLIADSGRRGEANGSRTSDPPELFTFHHAAPPGDDTRLARNLWRFLIAI
jgi:hypothetical protein